MPCQGDVVLQARHQPIGKYFLIGDCIAHSCEAPFFSANQIQRLNLSEHLLHIKMDTPVRISLQHGSMDFVH